MKAQLPIGGVGSQVLEIRSPGLLQGPILTIDGQRAPKGKRRNTYLIQRDDGRTVTITLKPSLVYDLPGVEIDGTRFEVVPRLRWFEYLLASFPLVLILVGILGIVLAAILIVACIRLSSVLSGALAEVPCRRIPFLGGACPLLSSQLSPPANVSNRPRHPPNPPIPAA